jgi:hypothetical protein
MLVKVLHQDCDKSLAKNKYLPRNSYLVCYLSDQEKKFDIVQSNSRVSIFDEYYDKYRNVISINWTDGTVNPKCYNVSKPEKKKK